MHQWRLTAESLLIQTSQLSENDTLARHFKGASPRLRLNHYRCLYKNTKSNYTEVCENQAAKPEREIESNDFIISR